MHCKNKNQPAYLPSYNLFFQGKDIKAQKINSKLAVIASGAVKAPFLFEDIVLSCAATLPEGAGVLAQISVKTQKGWSGFYKLFYLSAGCKKTFDNVRDDYAAVDIDALLTQTPATHFKYRLTLLGKAKVSLICAALTQAKYKYNRSLALETLGVKDMQLPLKPVPLPNGRACSPAALTAVLNYWGKKTTLNKTLKGAEDKNTGLSGVWPLNTAYAAQLGLKACVVKCSSLAQIEAEIYQGRPVITSVAYKKGQLKNAPVAATRGRLIAVTGLDKAGNIIAADSAAKAARALRVYDRAQFARAWIKNKKGIAYAIQNMQE
ncbi:MAG: C39 family peptidase [Elusimicrobiota bacterium]|jgi:hypothetical protein|nr:C39 family peptidase [Elusimicrobiota bacterium]